MRLSLRLPHFAQQIRTCTCGGFLDTWGSVGSGDVCLRIPQCLHVCSLVVLLCAAKPAGPAGFALRARLWPSVYIEACLPYIYVRGVRRGDVAVVLIDARGLVLGGDGLGGVAREKAHAW